ncbi:hypothetical protein [Actinoallomurus soli]|uniref:hypothetical protein n=1 Tax=Actinoallomurus soli TaxID=2952535 RepID=UPI00209260EF|nr:hypothetical protein [Actinoallomurus soli]MCO5972596.1 hypothetical protein [Actinoallomurus soli]
MTWQAPAAPPSDPFAAIETDVRGITSSPWWMGAPPHARAEALTSRMLAGAGEWWLFGAWGRWYRCGLDGNWHLCPPPFDPAARQAVMPAPPGAGRPPVPPSILTTGPDLTPGPLAGDGLFGAPPSPTVLGRLQQTVTAAATANPAQFPLQDPHFLPGTPSPIAVSFFAVLWCAGAPVTMDDHPILGLYARHLVPAAPGPRWFLQPALPLIVGAYTERLRAGDPMGASYVARVLWETAEALRGEPAFRPRADALAAIAATTLRMVPNDHAGVRYGDPAIVQEWLRRCPPELRVTLLRETAPGDHFRLACYDLAAMAAALPAAAAGPAEARRVAFALLAADLDGAPGAAAAVLPWLDPEAVRTLQSLAQPGHPLRELWPVDGTLPGAVAGADPQILRTLLAAAYATALSWCRLAGMAPPRPGFTVPAALLKAIDAGPEPGPGEGLTPWEIIEAARAHLAEQRKADAAPPPQPATTAWPASEPLPSAPSSNPAAPPTSDPGGPGGPAAPTSIPGVAAGTGPSSHPGTGPSSHPGTGAPAADHGSPVGGRWSTGSSGPASDSGVPEGTRAWSGFTAPASDPGVPGPGAPGPSSDPVGTSPAPSPYDGWTPEVTSVTPDPAASFPPAPPTALTPDPGVPPTSAVPADPAAGAGTPPPFPSGTAGVGAPPHHPDPVAGTGTPPPYPLPAAGAGTPPSYPTPAAGGDGSGSFADPAASPYGPGPRPVEAYGITFLPGPDDIEHLLTELRRRGSWALSLRGQEVSSASAPAVLLVGELSCGQRRLTRMIARALAEVGVGSGEVHTLLADELAEIDPRRLRDRLAEYNGHTLLIEDLDTIVLDDDRGAAYASALYRARVEGVSETVLAATCAPGRLRELTDAIPELITDLRTVRLPDLSDPELRVHLAALLAGERRLKLEPEAWQVARRDLAALRGRGRLTNARLVEAYLDRACNHHLGQVGETQVFQGQNTLTLSINDFQGVAAELEP